MSAMEKMLLGTLTKSLPPEVAQHMSPDGIKALGEKLGAIASFHRVAASLAVQQNYAILANQKIIMEALNVGEQFNPGPTSNVGGDANGRGDSVPVAA